MSRDVRIIFQFVLARSVVSLFWSVSRKSGIFTLSTFIFILCYLYVESYNSMIF